MGAVKPNVTKAVTIEEAYFFLRTALWHEQEFKDYIDLHEHDAYESGYEDGHEAAGESGWENEYNRGHEDGYESGHKDGFDEGYKDGYNDGAKDYG